MHISEKRTIRIKDNKNNDILMQPIQINHSSKFEMRLKKTIVSYFLSLLSWEEFLELISKCYFKCIRILNLFVTF